jgi:hypothetical protein
MLQIGEGRGQFVRASAVFEECTDSPQMPQRFPLTAAGFRAAFLQSEDQVFDFTPDGLHVDVDTYMPSAPVEALVRHLPRRGRNVVRAASF